MNNRLLSTEGINSSARFGAEAHEVLLFPAFHTGLLLFSHFVANASRCSKANDEKYEHMLIQMLLEIKSAYSAFLIFCLADAWLKKLSD